jgi:hypothetical protein
MWISKREWDELNGRVEILESRVMCLEGSHRWVYDPKVDKVFCERCFKFKPNGAEGVEPRVDNPQ